MTQARLFTDNTIETHAIHIASRLLNEATTNAERERLISEASQREGLLPTIGINVINTTESQQNLKLQILNSMRELVKAMPRNIPELDGQILNDKDTDFKVFPAIIKKNNDKVKLDPATLLAFCLMQSQLAEIDKKLELYCNICNRIVDEIMPTKPDQTQESKTYSSMNAKK